MKLHEALRLLRENDLICEFVNTVLTRDQLIRVLKRLNPSFDPETDIRKKNQMAHNKEMITLKPNYLKGTNLGPKEFADKMLGYGWNVLGYSYNQIVLAKARETSDPESLKFSKWDKLKDLQNRAKGLYVRFSDYDPDMVKRVGFRGINDLNIDWNDQEKRSSSKMFNERHVYMFSMEYLVKSAGSLNGDKLLKRIYRLAHYGKSYGRYCYFIRLPSSVKVYNDPETKGDGIIGSSGVYTTQKILPSWIEGYYNVVSSDGKDEILHKLGLDDLGDTEERDVSSEIDDDTLNRRFDDVKKATTFEDTDYGDTNSIVKRLQDALRNYDRKSMVIYDALKGDKKYLASVGFKENYGIFFIFLRKADGDKFSGGAEHIRFSINRDGTSATLLVPSEYEVRSSNYKKSDELKRYLADPEVVACAKEYASSKDKKYDPRNHEEDRYFPNWD